MSNHLAVNSDADYFIRGNEKAMTGRVKTDTGIPGRAVAV